MPTDIKTIRKTLLSRDVLQNLITLGSLAALVIIFSSMSEYFLSSKNMMSIMLTATSVGLIAIGQTLCLISREFDMSVGMVAAMSGIIFTLLVKDGGWSIIAAFAASIAFGLLSGAIAGFCVSRLHTNSWITTFALLQIYRGIIFILTAGMPISVSGNEAFKVLGTYKVFGSIPLPVMILVVAYLIFIFIMKYTKIGRKIYCVGGNPDAAHVSGINVANIKMFAFMTVAVLASVSGVLFASRVSSGQPFIGDMYAMDSIAAAVVGGTAMSGGKGTIWGTFIGVMIVNVIQNGLIMIGMPSFYQYIATGTIMFIAVLIQTERKK